jgi:hypothetical protein
MGVKSLVPGCWYPEQFQADLWKPSQIVGLKHSASSFLQLHSGLSPGYTGSSIGGLLLGRFLQSCIANHSVLSLIQLELWNPTLIIFAAQFSFKLALLFACFFLILCCFVYLGLCMPRPCLIITAVFFKGEMKGKVKFPFDYSCNKYLLRASYMSGSVLGRWTKYPTVMEILF